MQYKIWKLLCENRGAKQHLKREMGKKWFPVSLESNKIKEMHYSKKIEYTEAYNRVFNTNYTLDELFTMED
jgi:hypothetical protein